MKEYTSPAVTEHESVLSYLLTEIVSSLVGGPLSVANVAVGEPRPFSVTKLLGDDFTSLRIDSLTPCLEA